jgi:guanosine-3',5'-bis(diphosphate) 3'-pyrophosphohydrolase
LNWIRQLVEWQKEMTDPNEFLSSLKMDLFPDEVYTFTPKGKVVVVPAGATPVDFAYTIHTEVGHTCVGSQDQRAHGAAAHQAAHRRHRGDRDAEGSQAEPRLAHVCEEPARPQQDQALAERGPAPARAVEIGRKLLEREARKFKVPMTQIDDQDLGRVAQEFGVATASPICWRHWARARTPRTKCCAKLAPGFDKLLETETGTEIKPGEATPSDAVRRLQLTGSESLQVEGQNDLLVYRARCCNPIRGEEIVGYVTRGKGVAVHARSCPNVQNLLYESDRRINVEWSRVAPDAAGKPQRYPVKITIFCDDRTGMLKELTAVISDENADIRGVDLKRDDEGEAIIEFIVEAEDVRHLNRMVLGLKRVKGVRQVQRTQKV